MFEEAIKVFPYTYERQAEANQRANTAKQKKGSKREHSEREKSNNHTEQEHGSKRVRTQQPGKKQLSHEEYDRIILERDSISWLYWHII